MNTFVMKMQYSGYGKKFRHEVIDAALKAHEEMVRKDREGEVPLYRPKEWKREEREQLKRQKRKDWYKKGGYRSVIFVPATPNSELRKMLEEDVQSSGIKIKIVETAGTNMKRMLQRSDPFKSRNCLKEECIVCQSGGKGRCRASNVTYRIECQECHGVYVGETSRNTFTRGKEHLKDMESRSDKSVLWRHARDSHQGTVPVYRCDVTEHFRNDALLRQVSEAVKINKEQHIINTKNEWNFINIPRAKVDN